MKALICGAGIAGLTAARQLHCLGWECTVLERSPRLSAAGYVIDLFGPGFAAAEQMGLLARLRDRALPLDEWRYVNSHGRRVGGISYRRLANALDGRLLSLTRSDLQQALFDALDGQVEVRFGRTINEVHQSAGNVVTLSSDGHEYRTDLLIGADGIHSQVRNLVFGAEREYLRPLGFHVAAYSFADADLCGQVGNSFVMTDSVGRLLGVCPADGRVNVLAVRRCTGAQVPDDPRAAVLDACAGLGWIAPRLLRHCPEPPGLYYDAVAQIRMRSWSAGHVVLLGDACHAVSLLAGQGASLAIAGPRLLAARVTEELARGGDLRDALASYQSRLLPAVRRRQSAGRRTADWFLPGTRRRQLLRRSALHLMGMPGCRRLVISALTGGSDDDALN